MEKLTQEIFEGMPSKVDWAGVDYDGELNFGKAINPRYTWASERWRGFEEYKTVENTDYERLTSIRRDLLELKKVQLEELKDSNRMAWHTYGSELCAGDMIRQEKELEKEILQLEETYASRTN